MRSLHTGMLVGVDASGTRSGSNTISVDYPEFDPGWGESQTRFRQYSAINRRRANVAVRLESPGSLTRLEAPTLDPSVQIPPGHRLKNERL